MTTPDPTPPAERVLHTEGEYGYIVHVVERKPGGNLYLRFYDPSARGGKGGPRWRSRGHKDLERAKINAADLSLSLRKGEELAAGGSLSLSTLFARYLAEVSIDKKEAEQKRDALRADLIEAGLGGNFDARGLDRNAWKRYARARTAGTLTVEGRRPRAAGKTTLRHELVFLRAVLTWATTTLDHEGNQLLPANLLAGVKAEKNPSPNAPTTTFDRFIRVYRYSNRVDDSGRFRAFLSIVEGKGWRVTAVCELRACDLDLRRSSEAPHGRILKRGETDKMGKERWALLTAFARKQIDRMLRRHPSVGRAYLFPSPTKKGEPWQDQYALDLLHKAEMWAGHWERLRFIEEQAPELPDSIQVRVGRWVYPVREYVERHPHQVVRKPNLAAKIVQLINEGTGQEWIPDVEPESGHGFHGLRRKWATERKSYPIPDVAYEGDWNPLTLLNFYQKSDPGTRVDVALAPEKLRESGGRERAVVRESYGGPAEPFTRPFTGELTKGKAPTRKLRAEA